jgi:hypothetical protein
MEQCQSLKVLTFMYLEMDENHCRVLGAYVFEGGSQDRTESL